MPCDVRKPSNQPDDADQGAQVEPCDVRKPTTPAYSLVARPITKSDGIARTPDQSNDISFTTQDNATSATAIKSAWQPTAAPESL